MSKQTLQEIVTRWKMSRDILVADVTRLEKKYKENNASVGGPFNQSQYNMLLRHQARLEMINEHIEQLQEYAMERAR